MASSHVIDRDRGYAELKKRWMNHKNSRGVAVGIFGQGAAEDNDGVTNLLIAIIHEFGAPRANVPARSWLRAFVDENHEKIRQLIRMLGQRVLKGEITHDQALGQLGAWIVGGIQTRMAQGIDPPLAPSTIENRLASDSRQAQVAARRGLRAAKSTMSAGGSVAEAREASTSAAGAVLKPLIDKGQFRQSITFEVRDR